LPLKSVPSRYCQFQPVNGLGYLLKMDGFDCLEYGDSRACDVHRGVRAAGLQTSLDWVGETRGRLIAGARPMLSDPACSGGILSAIKRTRVGEQRTSPRAF
jgi:hypothetical protein